MESLSTQNRGTHRLGMRDRDKESLSRLIERLSKWDIVLFCTYDYALYVEIIAKEKLIQSRYQIYFLEKNNGRLRHWYALFHGNSIVVSKTIEMVNLTTALFAAVLVK